MTHLLEGIVKHECGWVSDGNPFREGAGCPKCGKAITVASLMAANEPFNLTNPEDLKSLTVPQLEAFISELPAGPELAEIELLEQAGKNRSGVLAAIRARLAEVDSEQ